MVLPLIYYEENDLFAKESGKKGFGCLLEMIWKIQNKTKIMVFASNNK